MAKMPTYKGKVGPVPKPAKGPALRDTKAAKVSPNKEQFAPTEASPVPQRYKMAGGS